MVVAVHVVGVHVVVAVVRMPLEDVAVAHPAHVVHLIGLIPVVAADIESLTTNWTHLNTFIGHSR